VTVRNGIAPHPLASYGGRATVYLVAEDETVRVALGSYYTLATNALDDFAAGAVRGAAAVSEDYKPDVRLQRQRELLRAGAAKVATALDSELQRLAASAAAVRDELRKAANPPPSSESALLDFWRESEVRRELETLPPDERRAFVRSAARRGDPLPVRAVEGSPVRPLIPDVDLQRAKQELLEAREPALRESGEGGRRARVGAPHCGASAAPPEHSDKGRRARREDFGGRKTATHGRRRASRRAGEGNALVAELRAAGAPGRVWRGPRRGRRVLKSSRY
jgi:hypothetical protein